MGLPHAAPIMLVFGGRVSWVSWVGGTTGVVSEGFRLESEREATGSTVVVRTGPVCAGTRLMCGLVWVWMGGWVW